MEAEQRTARDESSLIECPDNDFAEVNPDKIKTSFDF